MTWKEVAVAYFKLHLNIRLQLSVLSKLHPIRNAGVLGLNFGQDRRLYRNVFVIFRSPSVQP
jgi:hypothetical protein